MSTRSSIAVMQDGKVTWVYCHYDGYVKGVGATLIEHYSNLSRVTELLSHGNMSSLGENINPTGSHSFDKPERGVTVYYGRDRGEEHEEALTGTLDDWLEWLDESWCEYAYIFKDYTWYVAEVNYCNVREHRITENFSLLKDRLNY